MPMYYRDKKELEVVKIVCYTNIPLRYLRVRRESYKEGRTHTMPAVWRVDKNPHIMADSAILAITLLREGAKAPKTPI